jgi:amino acid transporter
LLPRRLGSVHPTHHSPAFSSVVQTATATLIVLMLAVFQVDPLVGVFGSMAGVATVGMVILMLTTSAAVLAYFMRQGGGLWQTRVAPALACIGLLVSMWLVLSNFTLVTGGSFALSTMLAVVPFLGLLIGFLIGQPKVSSRDAAAADATAHP